MTPSKKTELDSRGEKSRANQKPLLELSENTQINDLLNDVIGRLKDYTEGQTLKLDELTKIGVALSAVRDLDRLLEMIVDKARAFTNADGGSLYLVSEDRTILNFSIIQNESLGLRMGGATGGPITFPSIALSTNGAPNNANVCAYVANSGKTVNIEDVYEIEGFNFVNTRRVDKSNNYRSKSMLVIPMRDHENDVIGVLQLINARDLQSGETIAFATEYQRLSEALASQAAIALTNAKLINDLQELFESFIRTIASAIDAKSHYTGGHIERVANLTMDIANRINQAKSGHYADTRFTEDQLLELRLAAWLHDTGKITTPEYVVDKRTKLETIFDRKELVRYRFELAMANQHSAELMADSSSGSHSGNPDLAEPGNGISVEYLKKEMEFVLDSNATSEFVPDEIIEHLKSVADRTVVTSCGQEPLLTENELYNLSIRKGNLTSEERKVIDNHAVMTIKMLEELPFPRKMKNVPFIAGAHHEKLNGKGYPNGLTAEQIPLQVRILALADIFEALTAKDRPYKEPKTMTEALKILGFTAKDSELDPDLVQFFLDEKMHIDYGRKHLDKFQMDLDD